MTNGTALTPAGGRRTWRVITRRRKWLITAAGVLLAGTALWWSAGRGGKMEVKLVFLGYTNNPTVGRFPNEGPMKAIIMASNSGTVTVNLPTPNIAGYWVPFENRFADDRLQITAIEWPLTVIMKPGETWSYALTTKTFSRPWGTSLLCDPEERKRGLGVALKVWITTRMPSRVRQRMYESEMNWVFLGPITNLPPAVVGAGVAPASGGR